MMNACGIDPGLSGAVAFIGEDPADALVFDMPTVMTTTGRRQIDAAALADLLREHGPALTLVEKVSARPGEGAVGAFSFGHTLGSIVGVLGALALPYSLVAPVAWKRKAGLPARAPKEASMQACVCVLPHTRQHLTMVKHHGRAEALLIALQARSRLLVVPDEDGRKGTPGGG